MEAKRRLEDAWQFARAEHFTEGRIVEQADAETAWKLGWIAGYIAALDVIRPTSSRCWPTTKELKDILEGTNANK